ncbi:uncharacterized protein LOC112598257 [Melanaphis sacchari]|uniref:uncharacterized protein LOC112598257 n=1 Tax=Melanaphis sacchari TaxID=742174 RepID=UPI000DC14772|nr:uncharacterized protein LOC112598257 [Melanaphis sacchari]
MFQAISTLLLVLQSIISHPISNNISDEEYLHPAKKNVDGFYSAPPCGEGQFRDPLEILGVKFPESKIKQLCKANVYMYADSISDVHFPPDAVKLCTSVCKCYQESMYIEPSINVTLINSNCDYTGDTIIVEHSANETHAATCPDLSTACVCSYNVRCNRKTRLMKYTLTANERGYLRVMVADCGASACVT